MCLIYSPQQTATCSSRLTSAQQCSAGFDCECTKSIPTTSFICMLIQFNSMADGYRRPKRKIERIQKIRRGRRLAVTRVSLLSNHQLSPAQLDRDSFQLCLWRPSPNETIPGPAAAAAVAVLRAETVQQQFQQSLLASPL